MNFPNFIPQERKPFFGKLLAVISRWNLVKIKEKKVGQQSSANTLTFEKGAVGWGWGQWYNFEDGKESAHPEKKDIKHYIQFSLVTPKPYLYILQLTKLYS